MIRSLTIALAVMVLTGQRHQLNQQQTSELVAFDVELYWSLIG